MINQCGDCKYEWESDDPVLVCPCCTGILITTQDGSLDDLKQILAQPLLPQERPILDMGSDHSHDCRCDVCRKWWKLMGPDEDGSYGPFTEEEVHGQNSSPSQS